MFTGLSKFRFYRGLKDIKLAIRQEVIENIPKAHRTPDALYLKEHSAMPIRLTAAIYLTDANDFETKERYVDEIMFELMLLCDEVEEQEQARVISQSTAASIYVKIRAVLDEINKFKNYLKHKRVSDGSRVSEGA